MGEPVKTLVIGIGSPIRGDDGIGPALAERVCLGRGPDWEAIPFQGSGFDLLGAITQPGGYDRVVLIDSMDNGTLPVGEVARVDPLPDIPVRDGYASSHHVGVLEAFRLAPVFGASLPDDVRLYAVGVDRADGFREGLSTGMAARLDELAEAIARDLVGRTGEVAS
jgi:hydrogenase maturation protease